MSPLDLPSPDASAGDVAPVRRRRGRPPSHTEPWTKVTVVLFDRQVAWLDRLASDIRGASGASCTRAQIIRTLVDSLAESDIDPTAITSEAELRARIAGSRGGAPPATHEP